MASFRTLPAADIFLAGFSLAAAAVVCRRRFWFWLCIGGIIFILGAYRYQLSLPVTDPDKIWFYAGQQLAFTGIIDAEIDERIDKSKLIVAAKTAKLGGQTAVLAGRIMVNAGLYPKYRYGDELAISCKIIRPEKIEDFDYGRYLAKDGIYAQCLYPKIKLIARGRGNRLLAGILAFKLIIREQVSRNLPEPAASLFFAMNFGSRGGIPRELSDSFNTAGATHLIAISGMNITIIINVLMGLLLYFGLPRRRAFWLVTVSLILYILLIGYPASAFRAAIMGWLIIFAAYAGRQSRISQALFLTAAMMVFINPKILRDDAGFQLSFLAVIGLINFQPFFDKLLGRLPDAFCLRESLTMTLAAQLATLPLIVFSFGRLSLIAPLANIFVAPIMLFLMISGFFSIALSFICPPLALFFYWPTYLIMVYIIKTVGFFAAWPLAAINV